MFGFYYEVCWYYFCYQCLKWLARVSMYTHRCVRFVMYQLQCRYCSKYQSSVSCAEIERTKDGPKSRPHFRTNWPKQSKFYAKRQTATRNSLLLQHSKGLKSHILMHLGFHMAKFKKPNTLGLCKIGLSLGSKTLQIANFSHLVQYQNTSRIRQGFWPSMLVLDRSHSCKLHYVEVLPVSIKFKNQINWYCSN